MKEKINRAAEFARNLTLKGMPKDQAVRMAADYVLAGIERSGMSQEEALDSVTPQFVQDVRESLSPWLWLLPIATFTVAMINYKRISKYLK